MLLNLERAREKMASEGLDALVLAQPINIIYGGDFGSEFLLGRFEDWSAAVVLPRDPGIAPALVIPEFDLPYLMESPSWIEDVQLFGNPWSSVGTFMGETLERSLSTPLRQKLRQWRDKLRPSQKDSFVDGLMAALDDRDLTGLRLGCDTPRLGKRLQEEGCGSIVDGGQTIRRIRMVKTPQEVDILTGGARLNALALENVIAAGAAGASEDDMTRIYRVTLAEHDGRHLGERGMMFGTGDASSFSLPAGGDRRLESGDAIVLDCLGTHRNYYMDLARTGVVGKPTEAQKLRYNAVLTALRAVEDAIRPGVHTQDLRALTRDTIAGFGLRGDLVSVTTHGIGLEVFEFPETDSLVHGFPLEEGTACNTEVFYRDPELGSFHLEDTVLVTANGCRLLHEFPRDLVVFQ